MVNHNYSSNNNTLPTLNLLLSCIKVRGNTYANYLNITLIIYACIISIKFTV